MRPWQKLVLAALFLTAAAALGGAGFMIYADQLGRGGASGATEIARIGETATVPPAGLLTEFPEAPPATAGAGPSTAPEDLVVAAPGSPTATPFQPLPITPTPSPSPRPSATPTLFPTATPDPAEPRADAKDFFIAGIWGYRQTFNLSCESRSASDLARYFGVDFTELEFLYALPSSDNPDVGFVGDVNGGLGQLPPLGYGVHAAPVAALMQSFGLDATAHKGLTLKSLKEEIAAGRPVMIWAIKDLGTSMPVEYTASDGDTTIVASFEHTFIVIGYGPGYITVLDNERVYSVSTEQFVASWGVLGNMAITVSP